MNNLALLYKICLLLILPTTILAQPGFWLGEVAINGSPDPRHEASYVAVGARFYLLGGRGVKSVNIYDPVSKIWTDAQAPPLEIHHFQSIEFQGKIYIIGSLTGNYPNETAVPNIYIYDPVLDNWSVGATIPVNRRRGASGLVLHNNKFYLVCGIINGHKSGHVNWLDVYDPITDSWQMLADAPRARDHFHASEVHGKIYAIGGRRTASEQDVFANTVPEVDVYDIATKQWTTLSQDLPTERAGTFNAIIQDEILVLGGESLAHQHSHQEVEVLNTQTGTWTTYSPMPIGRNGTGGVWYLDTLFTASGSGERGGGLELDSQDKFFIGQSQTNRFKELELNPFTIHTHPGSSSYIRIYYEGQLKNIKFKLYTLSGSLIDEKKEINTFPSDWHLSKYSLVQGLYLLQIETNNGNYLGKLLLR